MDDEMIRELLQGEIFWYETSTTSTAPTPTTTPSAFVPYSNKVVSGCNNNNNNGVNNMNKRVFGFLKKSWPNYNETNKDNEKERCFRHMMNERMRREKQKRSYFDLHSMLPHGTKNDKNSIVQTARKRIQELEWLKRDLERRNYELQVNLGANNYNEENKIRVKIERPVSGIDSMLETLKCLKALDTNPTMIRSKFTTHHFLAVMGFEAQGAAKVEEAVNRTLQETERKLRGPWTNRML